MPDVGRRLLVRLLKVAPAEKREAQRLRAEAMLQGDANDQRLMLAEAISSAMGWKYAVPYYRSLLERANAKEKPEYAFISHVLHQLRNGYITAGDYRGLLQTDEDLRHLVTNPRIISPWPAETQIRDYFVYAMVAAKAGEKTEALRYVTQWVNQDRRAATFSVSDARTMYSGGYSYTTADRQLIWDELRTVFDAIEKAEPQCAAPDRLWKALRESPSKGEIPTIQ